MTPGNTPGSKTEFTPQQIQEWKDEMEEKGDPKVDVYFHEDETPQEEPDKDSDSEGDESQEETEVIPEE